MSSDATRTTGRNARYGLVLFLIYVVFYAGFVAICAFSFETMRIEIAGVNLAVIYGLGLIVLALVLAIIYMLMCRKDAEGGA